MKEKSIFDYVSACSADAGKLKLKANMMIAIRSVIDKNNWKQAVAAEELGVTQPRISSLRNGKIDDFSIDMLISMLLKLGTSLEVDLTHFGTPKSTLSIKIGG